jgi:hypothetical protein
MRVHLVALALRYLRGRKAALGAPYYGRPTYASEAAAVKASKTFTGENFGTDTRRWSAWLRKHGYGQLADTGLLRRPQKRGTA